MFENSSNSLMKLILVLFKLRNAFNSKYYTFWEPISSEFIVRYYEKNNFLGCLNYNQNLGTNVAAKIINRCKSDNLNVLFYFKQWYSSHPLFIFVIIRKPIKLRSSILFILREYCTGYLIEAVKKIPTGLNVNKECCEWETQFLKW